MTTRMAGRVWAGVALIVLGTPALAQGATEAAQPGVAAGGGIEEIVVTAQKRLEGIQTVPIAISAFTGDTLAQRQIEKGIDLQLAVPNLILVGNDRPTLRGIGNNAISSTAENGTASFTNGAYVGGRPENEFFDLARIEVLRGPQGTLFGRNTTGGAINVVTARPNNELGGHIQGTYGNFNSVKIDGALNLPLGDAIQQRFAGYYLRRDGFTFNEFNNNRIDSRDQYGVRSSTRLVAGDDTEANLVVQYYSEDDSRSRENKRLCKATPVLGCSPNELGFDSPNAQATVFQRLLAGFFTGSIFPPGGNIYAGAPNPTSLRRVAADTDPTFEANELLATFEAVHRFGNLSLTSLTGYSRSRTEANTDYDNAALPFRFLRPITYTASAGNVVTTDRLLTTDSFKAKGRTFTQELRLASSSGKAFDFTIGGFYLKSSGGASFEIWHPALELAAIAFGLPVASQHFINESPKSTTESYAAFGEGYLRVGAATKLTVGLRYSHDDKFIRTRSILLAAPPPFTEASTSSGRVTGKVAIDHKADFAFTDESLLYASYAHGYKAGGLNPGSAVARTFKPEIVDAVEVGIKNQLAGRTVQANLTAFYYDYKDLQLGQRINGGAVTSNGSARILGVEAEFLWVPTRAFQANLNLSYLDTRIDDFLTVDAANPAQANPSVPPVVITPAVAINLRGNELPYAPRFKVNTGAQYTVPLGDGGWHATLRGDFTMQSRYFAREFNTPNDRIKSWNLANALLRLDAPEDRYGVELWVKNIADKANITNSIIEDAQVGSYRNVRVLEPRTFGVTARASF